MSDLNDLAERLQRDVAPIIAAFQTFSLELARISLTLPRLSVFLVEITETPEYRDYQRELRETRHNRDDRRALLIDGMFGEDGRWASRSDHD